MNKQNAQQDTHAMKLNAFMRFHMSVKECLLLVIMLAVVIQSSGGECNIANTDRASIYSATSTQAQITANAGADGSWQQCVDCIGCSCHCQCNIITIETHKVSWPFHIVASQRLFTDHLNYHSLYRPVLYRPPIA